MFICPKNSSKLFLQDELVPKERRGVDWALMQQHPYIMGFCLVVVSVPEPTAI